MALPDVIIVLAAAFTTALAALWWLSTAAGRPAAAPPGIDDMSLLFEDGELIHGSDSALTRFALAPGHHRWQDIREALLSRFPEFPRTARHGATGKLTLTAEDGDSPSELRITWRDALCWLHLPQTRATEEITEETFQKLAALRRASETSPNPAWQTHASGRIIWHNRAYGALKRKAQPDPDCGGAALFSTPSPDHPNRVCLRRSDGEKPDWYPLSTTAEDHVQVSHATCINAVVAAEEAQRNFVQTLTKTFAALSDDTRLTLVEKLLKRGELPAGTLAAEAEISAPAISRHLKTLVEVGLGYVRLGQPATTLSGGEAQRVKLSAELQKRSTGRTVYVLDEPTTGLHFEDIRKLLLVLGRLVDAGNTVLVIEHNLDVIKTADWLVDMGPEGGSRGGTVVAEGTPEEVAAHPDSHTGRFLAPLLEGKEAEQPEGLLAASAAPAQVRATRRQAAQRTANERAAAKRTATKKTAAATKTAATKTAATKKTAVKKTVKKS